MSNPIGFKELFDFSDSTPITKAIELIDKLNGVYDKLIDQSTKNSQDYVKSINEILDAAKKLESQISDLDATEKAHQETIIKSAAEADKLLKKNEAYTKAVKDEKDQLAALTDIQNKLKSAKEKLRNENKAEAGSLDDLKKQLKDAAAAYTAMGDATSDAIKEEALNKVKALSKSVHEGEEAFKAARKAVDHAAGSYYSLNARVVEAKKRLKEMEGGIGSTSQEFKDLQAFVKKGSDQLKEFDEELGDSQRHVGAYERGFEALDNRIGGVIGQAKALGKEFLALASNPVVLTLAAIIGLLYAATSAVKTFFASTGEGEDMLEEQTAVWDAFFITIRKGWASLGKSIFDLGGSDVSKNLINSMLTAIETQFVFLIPLIEKFREKFNAAANDAVDLTRMLDALGDEIAANIITRSQGTLEANRLLEQSGNKLLFTDKQRLEFLKEASAIQEGLSSAEISLEKQNLEALQQRLLLDRTDVDFLKQKINFDSESLDQLKQQIKDSGLLGEEKTKLAEQVAKVIDLEAQHYQQQKKNTKQIVSLTQEIEKAERDRINRKIDTELLVNKYLLEAAAKHNDDIVKDEDATLVERLNALNEAAESRIQALEIDKQNELNVVRRAAEERIRSEGREVTAALIAQDEALQNQRELIAAKYVNLIKDVNQATLDAVENNVFKQLKKDAEELNSDTATIFSEQARALESDFQSGNVTVRKLLQDRNQIKEQAFIEGANNQILALEKERDALIKYGHDTSAIDQKISAARLALAEYTNNRIVEGLQKVNAAAVDLAQQSFATASALVNAAAERDIMALEAKLAREEEAKNASIAIVGEDAQAKAFIEEQSRIRSKAIQDEINKEKRKAAIYDKAIAITQATVNTALGVSRALGSAVPPLNFILAALVGAAGALQIASIAAQPIPAFARGTDYSPEGWALVGEAGRELVRDRKTGKTDIAEGPQYRYLSRGSIVVPNTPTEQLLATAAKYGDGYLADQVLGSYSNNTGSLSTVKNTMDTARMVDALGQTGSRIVDAIIKQPREIFDEKGYRVYEQSVGARILRLDNRFKL